MRPSPWCWSHQARAARASWHSIGAAQRGGLRVGDLLSNARSKVLQLQTRDADPAADARRLAQARALGGALFASRQCVR